MSMAQSKNALKEPTAYERMVLAGLQGKPQYQGTADPAVIADRRTKNRAARKSRRINRKRSGR